MKNKLIGIIGLVTASTFAVTMNINSYGVLTNVPLSEMDSVQISPDGLYLIHKTKNSKNEPKSNVHYLGYINQVSFDTIGGPLKNFSVLIDKNEQVLDPKQISKIVLEPSNLDKTKDSDDDGLSDWEEYTLTQTDPQKVDTDGDGWWDKYETTLHSSSTPLNFNPRIADMPVLEMKMREIPTIVYNYTRSGQKDTSITISNGKENSTSHDKAWSHDWNWGLQSEGGWGGLEDGWVWSIGGSFNYGLNYSLSESMASTINSENATTLASSNGWSLNGATLTAPVVLYNSGDVAVNITKPVLELYAHSSFNGTKSFGELIDNTHDTPFTLNPGDSLVLNVTKNISVENADDIALYANYLQVRLQKANSMTSMKINANGGTANTTDFTAEMTEIPAKTANLIVDFGGSFTPGGVDPLATQYARISTLTKYNPEYTSSQFSDQYGPVRLREALATLGFELKTNTEGKLINLNGISDLKGEFEDKWALVENYVDPQTKKMVFKPYNGNNLNPDQITLLSGRQYTLIFTGDDDHDGVANFIEKAKKSDPKKPDTDGDGLNDALEIYGFAPDSTWTHLVDGVQIPFVIQTDPTNVDTDGDGIQDKQDPRPTNRIKSNFINVRKVRMISINEQDTVQFTAPLFQEGIAQKARIHESGFFEIETDQVFSKITAFKSNGAPLILDQINKSGDFARFKITGIPAESTDSVQIKMIPANGDESNAKIFWIKYSSAFQGANTEIKLENSSVTPWKTMQYSFLSGAQLLADSRTKGMLLLRSKSNGPLPQIASTLDRHIGNKIPGSDWTIINDALVDSSKTYRFSDDSLQVESGTKYYYKVVPYTSTAGFSYYYYGSSAYSKNTPSILISSIIKEMHYEYGNAGDDPLIQTAFEVNGQRKYKNESLANTGSNTYDMSAQFAEDLSFKSQEVKPNDEISFILWVYEHEWWVNNTLFEMSIDEFKNQANNAGINNVYSKWSTSPHYVGYQYTVRVEDLLTTPRLEQLDAKDSRDLLINSTSSIQNPQSTFEFTPAQSGSIERSYPLNPWGRMKMQLNWSLQ